MREMIKDATGKLPAIDTNPTMRTWQHLCHRATLCKVISDRFSRTTGEAPFPMGPAAA